MAKPSKKIQRREHNMSLWKKIKKILRQLAGKDLPSSVIKEEED